jgi:hypothetical protein
MECGERRVGVGPEGLRARLAIPGTFLAFETGKA